MNEPLSIGSDFNGWPGVQLVRADHLIVGEEQNEELVNDAEIGVVCVGRVSVVDAKDESESI